MKKLVSLATALVLCLAMFVGCGAKDVVLSDVMSKINEDFSISLEALKSTDDLNKYYNIDPADVKQFAAEIDANNDAPVEIVMIEAIDADAAGRVETALTTRYNSIVGQYASYTPEKLDMVKSCKVTKDGNFVSMIVADKADEMLKVYYENVK